MGVFVTALLAMAYWEQEECYGPSECFRKYIVNNNWPMYFGTAAIIITFVIALFHWGPALLLPERHPTQKQRDVTSSVFRHVIFGTNAPAKSVVEKPMPPRVTKKWWFFGRSVTNTPPAPKIVTITEPLPWATGTWFWWKAEGLFILLLLMYVPFGLHDELHNFVKGVGRIIKEHRDKKDGHGPKPTGGHGSGTTSGGPATPRARVSFWEMLSVELVGEVLAEFATHFFRNRRSPL